MITNKIRHNHYYAPKGFKLISRKTERYCFKCHKVKLFNLFFKPSNDFKLSSKCLECIKNEKTKRN